MTATTADAYRPARTVAFLPAATLIVIGIFSTTLAQDALLGRLPLLNLLKNELHVSRTASSGFFFLAGLAWYFKPLAGILTDAFPILGSRRKTYLLLSASLGAAVWLSVLFVPHRYDALLWVMVLLGAFMMTASTVVGAVLVETAKGGAEGYAAEPAEAAAAAKEIDRGQHGLAARNLNEKAAIFYPFGVLRSAGLAGGSTGAAEGGVGADVGL